VQLARIIGTVTATIKHPSFTGACLLVVQPLMHDRKSPDGDPQIVIDTLSASAGDLVVITSDGRMLRDLLQSDTTPARWGTLAMVDPSIAS
jgi:microcompartment protein CcmK/EutM